MSPSCLSSQSPIRNISEGQDLAVCEQAWPPQRQREGCSRGLSSTVIRLEWADQRAAISINMREASAHMTGSTCPSCMEPTPPG